MTYFELVDAVRAAYANADASEITEHIAFQFNIEGEGEGAFYLEIKDGTIHIEPYEYYDRDVLITTTAETLLKIGTGKLDPVVAYTLRKIKVDGSLDKALVLKKISPVSDESKAPSAQESTSADAAVSDNGEAPEEASADTAEPEAECDGEQVEDEAVTDEEEDEDEDEDVEDDDSSDEEEEDAQDGDAAKSSAPTTAQALSARRSGRKKRKRGK